MVKIEAKPLKVFFVAVISLCLVSTHAFSVSDFQNFKLSSTATLNCASSVKPNFRFLPSYGGFWLDGKLGSKPYSILVSRKEPETLANKFSVDRYWKESLEFSKSIDEKFQDLGCKPLQSYAYRCDRTVQGKSKQFAAEAVIWNSKSDLILVRAMSPLSTEDAKEVLHLFEVKLLNRLPASGSRK